MAKIRDTLTSVKDPIDKCSINAVANLSKFRTSTITFLPQKYNITRKKGGYG